MRSVVLTVIAAILLPAAQAYGQKAAVSDLAQMAGCWSSISNKKDAEAVEFWTKPRGKTMMGVSQTVSMGKTTGYEYMRFEERLDGLYFVARPHQSKEDTDFKLVSSKDGEFIFENKQHDFPDRVIYRPGGNKMTARVEGPYENKRMGIDFSFIRIPCN